MTKILNYLGSLSDEELENLDEHGLVEQMFSDYCRKLFEIKPEA